MFEMPIESGRLVVTFRRLRPKLPMIDACFFPPGVVPYGTLAAAVVYDPIEGHPGTLGASAFFVGDARATQAFADRYDASVMPLFAHAPRMLLGDHSFVYQKLDSPLLEGVRALKACEANRRFGTFRADATDVGCCFRTGWRRCVYDVRCVEGGVAGQILSCGNEDEDTSADE